MVFGMHARGPFAGRLVKKWSGKPRTVVSIDLGATCTSVAVGYLVKDQFPSLFPISGWPGPGQEAQMTEERLPTQVLYDSDRQLAGCGFDALKSQEVIDNNHWTPAKNFKLRLHSAPLLNPQAVVIEAMQSTLDLRTIYVDFMSYVLKHTQHYLKTKRNVDYDPSKVDVIFAHPNGWGQRQQEFLLETAVAARLIDDTAQGKSHVYFVEEGEAATRYCISDAESPWSGSLKKNAKFIVCDAGGSTTDISAYKVQSTSGDKIKLAELQASSCVGTGGLMIDAACKSYLERIFAGSQHSPAAVNRMVERGVRNFQLRGKRRFSDETEEIQVEVAGVGLNDSNLDITFGVLTIPKADVAAFFSPCVDPMIRELRNQTQQHGIRDIVLTGGVGDSPYVRERLAGVFTERDGYTVIVSNSSSNKAVAIGALMLAIDGGDVVINRQKRPFHTYHTDFVGMIKRLWRA